MSLNLPKKCEQIYLYYTHIITKVINPLYYIIPPSDIRRLYVWPLLQYVMLCQNCSLWSLPVSSISSSWSHYKYHPLSCMSFLFIFHLSLALSPLYSTTRDTIGMQYNHILPLLLSFSY